MKLLTRCIKPFSSIIVHISRIVRLSIIQFLNQTSQMSIPDDIKYVSCWLVVNCQDLSSLISAQAVVHFQGWLGPHLLL